MLRNCTSAPYAVNKARMVRLAEYSRDCLIDLRAETGIAYDERTQGTLQLFRTEKQVTGAAEDIAVLTRRRRAVRGAGRVRLHRRRTGARPPGQDRGRAAPAARRDRRLLQVHRTAGEAGRRRGREIPLQTAISGMVTEAGRIGGVETAAGRLTADAFVAGAGQLFARLCATPASRLPVYPVKGYSITVPIVDAAARRCRR